MKKKKIAAVKKTSTHKKPVLKKPMLAAQIESGKHHDIIQMILDDHKPLKRCIEVLRNSEMNLSSRRAAFNEFAPLLLMHAKAEEVVLYAFEKTEVDMREDAFEGVVEHALAENLIEDVKQSVDKDVWSAKVKVLAELVEHHIKEEETELFPELKKEASMDNLVRLGDEYLAEKNKLRGAILHPAIQREPTSQTVRH